MTRIGITTISVALASILLAPVAETSAQTAPSRIQMAQAAVVDPSAPRRGNRPRRRVQITPRFEEYDGVYPRYNPGPDAVRECNATYVQEYRPSGTVITPHMSCYWRRG